VGKLPDGQPLEVALGARTTVGRHPANQLRLSDREVSKEHAVVELGPGGAYVVRDLGSSNGTFVNGRRVREAPLRDGDELQLGSTKVVFRAAEQAPTGVTVVATRGSAAPAVLAAIAPVPVTHEGEFRPAELVGDLQALKQDYERLRIGHEFQRQVGTERDAQRLCEKILDVAFQLVPADNGVLFLEQPDGGLLPRAVKRRRPSGEEVVLSDTVLERVRESRQGLLTADAVLDARFSGSESLVGRGIRSAMAVPLVSSDVLRGVLFVDTRERTHAFGEKDLRVLSGIAAQAAVALENAELERKLERDAIARAELCRFLSPAVAEMVVKGQVELLRQGQLVEVSVLFVDIRGFTSMAEQDAPSEVVGMLNEFFTAMAEVVFRHEGNLDKFIGDCVMAVWGPPRSHGDDPARALRAALEMQQAVERLNAGREASGRPPLQVGVGVNTGQAVVGYMGSAERHEFTAIGDPVNLASRLCGLAQGGEVLATSDTVERAGGGFVVEEFSVSRVKGKERGVRTFRVLSAEPAGAPALSPAAAAGTGGARG
jgi:adenylate cyclase